MIRFFRGSVLSALVVLLFFSGAAQAVLKIEITRGVESALPIAIVPFGSDAEAPALSIDIAAVVAADLARSGLFSPLPRGDLLAHPHEGSEVQFGDWRRLRAANLVVGKVRPQGGAYAVQFQLFDVFKGIQLAGYTFRAGEKELRHVAHKISDIIYETITGVPGAFATRITYVKVIERSAASRQFSLMVADSDGDRKSTRLNSSHTDISRMPSSA